MPPLPIREQEVASDGKKHDRGSVLPQLIGSHRPDRGAEPGNVRAGDRLADGADTTEREREEAHGHR